MKKLIFVRHGKSSWNEQLQDHNRPLKKRAYNDAELVINAFRDFPEEQSVIWSSSATRALETAKIFQERLKVKDKNFVVKNELYTFSANELLKIVQTCDDSIEELMIFSHNPGITDIVNRLGNRNFDNIPTTGLTCIEFQTNSWKHLNNGKTVLYLFPKNLR